jgi:uncharacterized protein (TIGR02246 family)
MRLQQLWSLAFPALMVGLAARPALAQQPGQEAQAIVFTVRLPADAVLEIDGNRTVSSGDMRTFHTPPLPVGGHYAYTLKAASRGKEVTRKVHLAHGVDNSFDLRAEFRPVALNQPDAKQLTAVAEPPAARGGEADALANRAEAFVDAFQRGDARALAAFWAPDGEYTDQSGRVLKGRENIEKAFQGLFASNKGLRLRIDSDSLRFVTPEVALEAGTTEVFSADGAPPSRSRYSNVHVKRDGQWLLSSVRDTPYVAPSNADQLRGLEWALGEWVGEEPTGETERIAVTWAENQSFLVASFSTAIRNVPVGSATYWIGWDPQQKRIRSWSFDASGAFGEGSWIQDGTKWILKTSTVLRDGKTATATFVLTPVDAQTVALQSRERTVDRQSLPDTREVRMKRVR